MRLNFDWLTETLAVGGNLYYIRSSRKSGGSSLYLFDLAARKETDLGKVESYEVSADGRIAGGLHSTGLRMASLTKFERRGVTLPVGLFREAQLGAAGGFGTPGVAT